MDTKKCCRCDTVIRLEAEADWEWIDSLISSDKDTLERVVCLSCMTDDERFICDFLVDNGYSSIYEIGIAEGYTMTEDGTWLSHIGNPVNMVDIVWMWAESAACPTL